MWSNVFQTPAVLPLSPVACLWNPAGRMISVISFLDVPIHLRTCRGRAPGLAPRSPALKPALQGTCNQNVIKNVFLNVFTATCFCHPRRVKERNEGGGRVFLRRASGGYRRRPE